MNDLALFEFEGQQLRVITIEGEPWFVAGEVCRFLALGNPTMAVDRLDADERALSSIEGTNNGNPVNIVSEPGLYKLIMASRKEEAKAFQRWVTHEVIPTIRKTGSYSLTPKD